MWPIVSPTGMSVLSADETTISLMLYLLLLRPERWTHRRVESIEILDDRSIHRRVSLDIAIEQDRVLGPELIEAGADMDFATLAFTPLTLLRKEILQNFDLRDSDNRALPMLTKEQTNEVAGNALIFVAESVLDDDLPAALEHKLRFVVAGESDLARRELESWQRAADDPDDPHKDVWNALMSADAFLDFANSLVDSFMLLAVVDPFPTKRQVLKLSYEERFADEDTLDSLRALVVPFGWTRKDLSVHVSPISLGTSYHLEVAAPADLEIDAAQLRFEQIDPDGSQVPESVTVGGCLQRAHLYAGHAGMEFQAKAVIYLRRQRDTFLLSAFLTALLVCLLLAVGLTRLDSLLGDEHTGQSQTAAALLLITPTLLAAYIVRPGEHRLAAKILSGVRMLVVGTAFCAVVAVGVLAAGYSSGTSRLIWSIDLGIASVIAVALLASLVLPRPTRA
jgi:hypothetical protein